MPLKEMYTHWLQNKRQICTQTHICVSSQAQKDYIDQEHCCLMAKVTNDPQSHQESWIRERREEMNQTKGRRG